MEKIKTLEHNYEKVMNNKESVGDVCKKQFLNLEYCLKINKNDKLKCENFINTVFYCYKNHGVFI
jgi:hypothetical protein